MMPTRKQTLEFLALPANSKLPIRKIQGSAASPFVSDGEIYVGEHCIDSSIEKAIKEREQSSC